MTTRTTSMAIACAAALSVCAGVERHWTGAAGNNDWTDTGNYDAFGVPDPTSDDTLVFPNGAHVILDGDDAASCNIAQHLNRMTVADGASGVVLTVNVPENGTVSINGAIVPTGDSYSDSSWNRLTVYKTGTGDLLLNSYGKVKAGASYITDYYANFTVAEGSLRLPTEMTGATYVGCVTVSNGASFFTGIGGHTIVNHLYGNGIVTNSASANHTFRVDDSGDFYGDLCGTLSYASRGVVMLHGTNSSVRTMQLTYNQHNNPGVISSTKGITGVEKVGRIGEPSSTGLAEKIIAASDGSILLYLGKGEHTDKGYEVRAPEYVNVLDGGAYGGLVWDGNWVQRYGTAGQYGMANILLRGSNSVPCRMTGAVTSWTSNGTNYTFHISKKGTGAWHFGHNDDTTMTGGYTVHEGTLSFDTIGDTNVVTSLGKATNLSTEENRSTFWDATKAEPYAHTLGNGANGTVGTLEYMGETNCWSKTRATVVSGTGVLKQSGAGALVMSGFSPKDSSDATLVLDGDNGSTSNLIANMTDSVSGGRLSIVKRGGGIWTISENATFTGSLSVEDGTLILNPGNRYTWFRWTWKQRFANSDTGTKANVCGVTEFALYDKYGNRCNLNLIDRGSNEDNGSNQFYYYPRLDYSGWHEGWFGRRNLGNVRYLLPGECSIGNVSTALRTYAQEGTSNRAMYPSAMFDGVEANYFSGYVRAAATTDDSRTWVPIIMRLPEGSPEIKYWDYMHGPVAKRAVAISDLEGSVDGLNWEPIDSFDCEGSSAGAYKWQFKGVSLGGEAESQLGAPGREIRGTSTNGWSFLSGNPQVSVKSGAVLKAEGDVMLKRIKIDAATGAGSFNGFAVAPDAEVEIVNLSGGEASTVPVMFVNTTGLDGANGWVWTFSSPSGRTLFGRATISASGVHYVPMGVRIMLR